MGLKRKMARAAEQRAKAERRADTREERRNRPALKDRDEAVRIERQAELQQRLDAMGPEDREAYDRRRDARIQSLMNLCGPALLLAAGQGTRMRGK